MLQYDPEEEDPPSAVSLTQLDHAQRRLLYLNSAVLTRAMDSLSTVSDAEAQLGMFARHPRWLLVLLRCCRIPWLDVSVRLSQSQPDMTDSVGTWVPHLQTTLSALQQVHTAA